MAVYPAGAGATNRYDALTDEAGSVCALAHTGFVGAIAEQYRYDAWGRTTFMDSGFAGRPRSLYGLRFLFQGGEYSEATGLYRFGARWYSPDLGRWLSPDPIGLEGGLNLYEFCGNNPVNFTDPSGLCASSKATGARDGEIFKARLRSFIEAEEIAAARSWWAPEWFVETLGGAALHFGGPFSPLDIASQRQFGGALWYVEGVGNMTSSQYGNYLAGYHAGYAESRLVYVGMRVGGLGWAIFGNVATPIFTLGRKRHGESWDDCESIPFINAGALDGIFDREIHRVYESISSGAR
jgi:RHS repeat-associated protein